MSNTYFFIRPRWVLRFDGTELSFQDLRFGGKRETFDLNSVSSVRLNDPIKLGGRQNELLLTVEERVLVLSLPMMEQSPEEVLQLVKDRLPVVEAGV
ncbi:MAG: hypothetical protein SFY81_14600 [Verrucomicrobiota bacterium]|nr:hypothetical protein [Verrucomicrobiota bacterium]